MRELLHLFLFSRIQQVDGGFFEKFGSLFREQAEYAENQEQLEKQRVAAAAAAARPEKIEEAAEENNEVALPTVESDEASLSSSDSEVEAEAEPADLIATALNVSICLIFMFINCWKIVTVIKEEYLENFVCIL